MTSLAPGFRLIDIKSGVNCNGFIPLPPRVPLNSGAQPSSWRLCCRLNIGNKNLRHIRESKPQSSTVHAHLKSQWHGTCKATHAGVAPDTSREEESIGELEEEEDVLDGEEYVEEQDPGFRVTDVFDSEEIEDQEKEELEKEARRLAARFERSSRDEIPAEEEEEEEEGEGGGKRGAKRRKGMRRPPSKLQFTSQVPENLLPKVAIIGRPNVGKSALFNRIAGKEIAIVYDEPGVTRDRQYTRAFWAANEFLLADTGGVLTPPPPQSGSGSSDGIAVTRGGGDEAVTLAMKEAALAGLPAMIEKQAAQAVEEAEAVIFVVDGQSGLTAADEEIALWLHRQHSGRKHITLAVNKCESPLKGALQAADFWALGFTPFPVSAISGSGTGDLLDDVCTNLQPPSQDEMEEEDVDNRPLAVAIVGRPNVGKSSILNAMVGEQRTIVSPVSGTTRDAIDSDFVGADGKEYRLIDTAGIRRRGAVASGESKTEALSVNRAFRAIRRADVVALIIDAMTCVTEQDFRLGERIEREGKACVIVVNKWDTVPEKDSNTTVQYELDVRERLRCLSWAPVVYSSALTLQRIPKILAEARKAGDERARRLTTATLNPVIQEAITFRHPPAGKANKRGRIYYCTQAAVRPPTFVFFVNDAKLFPELYRRYMEKQIRKNVGYPGTPIRLIWRSKQKNVERERERSAQRKSNPSGSTPSPRAMAGSTT